MELLLWRWSTSVQISSAVMIAVFFAALARSDSRVELQWWHKAWWFNVAALSVTTFYWFVGPPEPWRPMIRGLYFACKTTFLLMLLQGAWSLLRPGSRLLTRKQVTATAVVALITGALLLTTIERLGMGQALVIAVSLGAGCAVLLWFGETGVRWLAAGMALRALLGLIESVLYASHLVPLLPPDMAESSRTFLSLHSSLDTGGEWMVALGCVLAVTQRTHAELRQNNARLLEAQDDLRRLVDHDPLTGLANRRSLQAILRGVQPNGATLLFFDLDDFKGINDLHGHHVGDECLRAFAGTLRECFRPDDHVVRYAGDEFLVVASGLDRASLDDRILQVRARLRKAATNMPYFSFSVGVGDLPPGGNPETAVQAADEAMYQKKSGMRRAVAPA